MSVYVDVERYVREVYRLPIDLKTSRALGSELVRVATRTGDLVSSVQYEANLVEVVEPTTPVHDQFMRENEFWDVP